MPSSSWQTVTDWQSQWKCRGSKVPCDSINGIPFGNLPAVVPIATLLFTLQQWANYSAAHSVHTVRAIKKEASAFYPCIQDLTSSSEIQWSRHKVSVLHHHCSLPPSQLRWMNWEMLDHVDCAYIYILFYFVMLIHFVLKVIQNDPSITVEYNTSVNLVILQ